MQWNKRTLLGLAAEDDRLEVVKVLTEKGANLNARDKVGYN